MNTNSSNLKPLIAMICCGLCWSTSSLGIKLSTLSSLQLVFSRSILVIIFLLIYLYFIEKKKFIINKSIFILSLFVATKYMAFIIANKYTAGANVVAISQTSMIFILLANCVMYKEMPRRIDVMIIVLTVVGIGLFFIGEFDLSSTLGNMVAIVSSIATAFIYLLSARLKTFEENLSGIILGSGIAAIASVGFIIDEEIIINSLTVPTLLYLALVQQCVAYTLYAKATRSLSAFACIIIATIEPVLSPFLLYFAIGEAPSRYAGVGAAIVIISVTAWSILDYKLKKENDAKC